MSETKDADAEYVEVKVTRKVSITLAPEQLLALSRKHGKVELGPSPAKRPGMLARAGQSIKNLVFGKGEGSNGQG
jgi:hypothetical protein